MSDDDIKRDESVEDQFEAVKDEGATVRPVGKGDEKLYLAILALMVTAIDSDKPLATSLDKMEQVRDLMNSGSIVLQMEFDDTTAYTTVRWVGAAPGAADTLN